jgi:hypothetical protein
MEQEIKSIVEKARSASAGCMCQLMLDIRSMIHAVNTDIVVTPGGIAS